MQIREFVMSARARIAEYYPAEEANAMTGILCCECFGVEPYTYMVSPEMEIKEKQLAKAEDAIVRLCAGEPLQYILGYAEFCGRRFKVSPAVLIPRPETEQIVRKVEEFAKALILKRIAYGNPNPVLKILDICSGSGCITWTLAADIENSSVMGLDISQQAVYQAYNQEIEIEKSRTPRFVSVDVLQEEDLTKVLSGEGQFDIIVSNPPYVLESEKPLMRRNVLDHEPEIALFVPDSNKHVFNKKIADICGQYLTTDGACFLEINEALGAEIKDIFVAAGFKHVEIVKDLSHKDRLAIVQK